MVAFIKAHWKILLFAVLLLGGAILGFDAGNAIAGVGASGGIFGLVLGWLHPKPILGAGDAAKLADAARTSADSNTAYRDAVTGSNNQAEKLGPILDAGKSLEATGDAMVKSDGDFINRIEQEGTKSP